MQRYRQRPLIVEAEEFLGTAASADSLRRWAGAETPLTLVPHPLGYALRVPTATGVRLAIPGDWVLCHVTGEFSVCAGSRFAALYEVDESAPRGPR